MRCTLRVSIGACTGDCKQLLSTGHQVNPEWQAAIVPDSNLRIYNAPEVAAHYGALEYLSPAERLFFERYLHPGDCILDLGVGGGRTTPYLSSIASRYVGADYAPEMVATCQRKFPAITFVLANATNLAMFEDESYNAVVMAFNGFDYVVGQASRRAAYAEVRRVLKPGGKFIFSAHNPRALWRRPSWNPRRVDELVERIAGRPRVARMVVRWGLIAGVVLVRVAPSLANSVTRLRLLFRRAFWSGEGYMVDPAHGGLLTHYGVPAKIEAEAADAGFDLLQTLGDDYPHSSSPLVTDWYYYAFSKSAKEPELIDLPSRPTCD